MVQTYTPLHTHTHYSLLDGFSTPEEYLKRCRELGIKNFAITEHANQYSYIYFSKLKKDYPDIKILYGIEIYETKDMNIQDKDDRYNHLLVIAKNENGRKALNKIVTISNFDGFYFKPRISIDRMAEFGQDLIVSSACLGSKIAMESDYDKCIEYINEYKSIFPHFYLEMQSHRHIDQENYNKKILKLSKDTNTPFVITTDAHAATEEELKYQGYHVMIAQDRETMGEMYEGCYLQSVEEIHEIMDKQIGEKNVDIGLENTNKIADLCDVVSMPLQSPKLPHFPLPEGFNSNKEYLRYLCDKGWESRKLEGLSKEEIQIRKDRLKYELSVINQMDFDGYFLILWDALNYARSQNIMVGDGRGSAVSSIVCYLTEITNLDPVKYNLIFERFLNPERIGMPDVDVDVSDRKVVIDYLVNKYGEDKVCQVMNFSYITPIVAIKDVASKILKIPYAIADKISKRFSYKTFEECIKNNPNIYDEYPQYAEWFDIASHLSGKIKNASIHAGGIGIVDTVMSDYLGMMLGKDGEHVIQVDKRNIEDIGIIKYDILGVSTLEIVKETIKEANIDPWEININNPEFENDIETYDLICNANTDLVFQMESTGMKDLAKRLQPRNMEELSAVIALYRPDSMSFIDDYINGKNDTNSIKYIHPDMGKALDNTYGAFIYQEQLLEIVKIFGGRSYGGADLFRKAVGKKIVELIQEEANKLYQEIIDNNYNKDVAKYISDMLSSMGNYSFNKSHSMGYASLVLQTAYLKKHYPLQFYKSALNVVDKKGLSRYILDAKNNGITIRQPDINKSETKFSISNNEILFGFQSLKGLGEATANQIIDERDKNGDYKGFKNFINRVNPGESLVVTLIKAGAIPLKNKREFLLKYASSKLDFKYTPVISLPTLKVLENEWRIDTKLYNTKEKRLEIYNKKKEKIDLEKFEEKKKLSIETFTDKYLIDEDLWEFETLSTFITYNPFEAIYENIKPFDEVEDGMSAVMVGVIAKVTKKKDRNKNQYAYIELYSAFGIEEITCWSSQFKQYQELIKKGNKLAILCKKKEGKGFVSEIKPYDNWVTDKEKMIERGW